jgi:hypothetical protein
MTQTFSEYLQEYVARQEPHTDDLLPEIYADWITTCDPELIVELAEKWHKEQMEVSSNNGSCEHGNHGIGSTLKSGVCKVCGKHF